MTNEERDIQHKLKVLYTPRFGAANFTHINRVSITAAPFYNSVDVIWR